MTDPKPTLAQKILAKQGVPVPAKAAVAPVAPTIAPEPSCASDAPEVDRKAPKGAAAKNGPRGKAQREDYAMLQRGRLPDGAHFEADYNDQTQTWTGHLIVNGARFDLTIGGIFKMLRDLDTMYRRSVQNPVATPEAPR